VIGINNLQRLAVTHSVDRIIAVYERKVELAGADQIGALSIVVESLTLFALRPQRNFLPLSSPHNENRAAI
jgi:hypothetical protein